MAKKKKRKAGNRVNIVSRQPASEVAAQLEALARGLRDGKFMFDGDEVGFDATPAGDVSIELVARRRRRRARIEVSIAFRAEELPHNDGDQAVSEPVAHTTETVPDEMTF